MSRFDAVRARWESTHHHHHRGDDSPTIPLLNNNTIDKSHSTPVMTKMDQGKFHYTIPGPGKRIASGIGGMWNKPLNTIRNKAFSRASRHASSEMSSGGGHSRKSESGTSFGHGSIKAGKNEKMIRSKTTSFLPVPTKSSARLPPPPVPTKPPLKHAKAGSDTRISSTAPRVSFSRPSYLPRSTTHPNLGTLTCGRRAAEYNRRNSTRWPLREDTRPLLRSPLLESPMLRTPTSEEEWFKSTSSPLSESMTAGNHGLQVASDPLWNSLNNARHPFDDGKENASSPRMYPKSSPPLRSPRLPIQQHQLMQPLQPPTPPSNGMFRNFTDVTVLNSDIRVSPTREVFANRQSIQRPPALDLLPVPLPNIFVVDKAMPTKYWSGRFLSMSDRILNKQFDVETRPTGEDDVESSIDSSLPQSHHPTAKSNERKLEQDRAFKVFRALDASCTTEEARRSLMIFRNMFAISEKMLELKVDIPPVQKPEDVKETLSSPSTGSIMSAGLRKMSFKGMLRARKSSGKSILSLRD